MAKAKIAALSLALLSAGAFAQTRTSDLYQKYEYMVPARDGTRLYACAYVPKNKPGKHPILLQRTPYSCQPYGPDAYRGGMGGSLKMQEAGYIFAFSDVRGKNMSEGDFVNVRPQLLDVFGQNGLKPDPHSIDESTDTYDTIDFLVKNVPENNGNVGLWGISYPGGYAAAGAMSKHPALKAASPQAPTADWFLGDDFHHNGAFFLQDFISFHSGFGVVRPGPGQSGQRVPLNIGGDAYRFFLDLGGLANVEPKLYQGRVPYWSDFVRHDTYDEFWQSRSIPSNLKGVKCALLWVGGFFDAEDCWGPMACYKAAEAMSPGITNILIMGPWFHGMWAGPPGNRFHVFDWGSNTSQYFQDEVEFPFFDAYLRPSGQAKSFPEVRVFDSGAKTWREYSSWPPKEAKKLDLYMAENKGLAIAPGKPGADAYVSDPFNPVPYQGGVLTGRTRTYMLDDQKFAKARPDVLTYTSEPLSQPVTMCGDITADLYAKVGGTDADFVVKVIDVIPAGEPNGGMEMLVRGEVMRAKFRNSFSNPSPLDPEKVERVPFALPGSCHTFGRGHRIMVQVQSSWFPLVDRNPHKFMNIFTATDQDFKAARIDLFRGGETASKVTIDTVAVRN